MRLRLAFCVALVCALSPRSAKADHWIMGGGTVSCGTWFSDKTEIAYLNVDRAWVLGFISGANFSSGSNVGKGTDANGIFAWIDQFCTQNPMKSISDASSALVNEWDKTH
jgi:hypothetical protein